MISAIVPYRPDGAYRERAWAWLRNRWKAMADVELIVSMEPAGKHPGEFNHPRAINRGVEQATGDVFVIADADTAFDQAWVYAAARLVQEGGAPWVLPLRYEKLTEIATKRVLKGWPTDPILDYETEWVGEGINWSGLVVVPRAGFEKVRGYDERFEWWGADDIAFGLTMDALWGKHHRLEGSALHLWHPAPEDETYGHERYPENDKLMRRYIEAAEKPRELEAVRFG